MSVPLSSSESSSFTSGLTSSNISGTKNSVWQDRGTMQLMTFDRQISITGKAASFRSYANEIHKTDDKMRDTISQYQQTDSLNLIYILAHKSVKTRTSLNRSRPLLNVVQQIILVILFKKKTFLNLETNIHKIKSK